MYSCLFTNWVCEIELDQALDDPNCTPLLLYPSHSAVDIQTLATQNAEASTVASNRYSCEGCLHGSQANSDRHIEEKQGSVALETPSAYPYKLVIVLDGSWSHAKIMYRCNPRLQQITQIKFPNPPQSIYHELKPEPKTTYTSTAEAVGQAVALLGWRRDKANADLLLEVRCFCYCEIHAGYPFADLTCFNAHPRGQP